MGICFLLLSLSAPAGGDGLTDEEALAMGRALVEGLGGRLKAALTEAGPAHAVEVCSLEAVPLTESISREQGVTISRITDRPRNPENRATPEEAALLARMRSDLSTGELAAVYDLADARYLPLRIAPLCLTCHGENLVPEVTTALADRYPEDEAIGYRSEELRGAIRIEKH